ncbi:MAG: alkaline phosphatase family protein [Burkholderiales bacterium]
MKNPRPLNVLLIVADQWRGDSLGSLGHRAARTPNLDALARDGVLFRQHYTPGAPCAPARHSLLTGQYVMNHGVMVNGAPLDDRHPTLPRELRRGGIEPALIGYTTTTHDPRRVGPRDPRHAEIGEVMDGWRVIAHLDETRHRHYFSWVAAQGHALPAVPEDLWLPAAGEPGPTLQPSALPAGLSDTAWSTAHALAYLRGGALAPQWLLHLGYFRPHPPFIASSPFNTLIPDSVIDPPVRAASLQAEAAQHPTVAEALGRVQNRPFFRGMAGRVADLSDAQIRIARRTYYGLIAELDQSIGEVIAELRHSGELEHTLIVFTSDHGEQLGDHHLFGKLGYFDESFHIPLIIRDPRRVADGARGRVVDAFTEGVDLMPTLLDLLGLPVPPGCDGRSLRPWLEGDTPADWRDAAHFEFDLRAGWPDPGPPPGSQDADSGRLWVLRERHYKYVHFQSHPPVLFDLRADPGQRVNLADDPAHLPVLARCAQRLLSWRMRHGERGLAHLSASRHGLIDRRSGRAAAD